MQLAQRAGYSLGLCEQCLCRVLVAVRAVFKRGVNSNRFDERRDLVEVGNFGFAEDALFDSFAGVAVDRESGGLVEEVGDGIHLSNGLADQRQDQSSMRAFEVVTRKLACPSVSPINW